ncbi:urease accessory protein UreE [Flavisolibacter ginsenosidimutans]|uniref:Urease accessory protein UreE n=1 Tax=Flavisolibacter ginsenosidimutans TaxID=661481 RepID=A0A5B8UD50_9BACT|nr:urease accessory protein UreE [Flavisolibacter ginsenosidimutans]QEC54494.1 urease accessory protein UreE [Flavisolibacter ginsenosidimutans]
MLIKKKIGNLSSFSVGEKKIDRLPLEWYECTKRILHKRTENGREVTFKFLKEAQNLQQDDVLFADEEVLIVVDVLPCEAIVLKPSTMHEMALVCYEIGNKHLPLFYEDDCLLIPYDAPTHRLLRASGFEAIVEKRKLLNGLRTTVSPHAHAGGESLFSKILKLTTTNE